MGITFTNTTEYVSKSFRFYDLYRRLQCSASSSSEEARERNKGKIKRAGTGHEEEGRRKRQTKRHGSDTGKEDRRRRTEGEEREAK